MIHPEAEPIDHIAPYKRIELGAKDRKPEPKWVPVPVEPVIIWTLPAIEEIFRLGTPLP